jgi:serine/threonine protein kinase
MFADFLYRQINKNLRRDTPLLPNINNAEISHAVKLLSEHKPIDGNDNVDILARYLFARTLKEQLEDPLSELSIYLIGKYNLRNLLRKVYMSLIEKTNQYLGRPQIAIMPGPFVLNEKAFKVKFGEIVTRISSGTFGVVYTTDKDFAIKDFKEGIDSDVVQETAILRYLDHPNILNVLGIQLDVDTLLAMPLATGTVANLLQNSTVYDSITNRRLVIYQILRGLAYCHSKYVWHLDIKPANILYFADTYGDFVYKIADFGLSRVYMRSEEHDTRVVTLWWRAPELLLDDKRYNEKVDIWAVGVILLDMINNNIHYYKERPTSQGLLSGDDMGEQLRRTLYILGPPTAEEWPNAKSLLNYPKETITQHYELRNLVKQGGKWKRITDEAGNVGYINSITHEAYKSQPTDLPTDVLVWRNSSNQEELDFLSQMFTWPKERISAIDALKSSYFDTVRDKIDTLLPALPITIDSCGNLMHKDIEQPLRQDWLTDTKRKLCFIWLHDIQLELDIKTHTLFLAYRIFDLYIGINSVSDNDLKLLSIACLKIANDMYESPSYEIREFATIANYLIDNVKKMIVNIITKLDFKLVIPTVSDFLENYFSAEEILHLNMMQKSSIDLITLALLFNYRYTLEYTPDQLSQIVIEALDLHPKCLKDLPKLYDSKIYYYLKNLPLPNIYRDFHDAYNLALDLVKKP